MNMGTDNPISVASYGDLIGDSALNVERADAVALILQGESPDTVAIHVPMWMLDQTSFAEGEISPEVIEGTILRETDKAIQVESGGRSDWLPKSVVRVYALDSEAEIHVPRKTLDEFAGSEESA